MLLGVGVLILISDQLSVHAFKEVFQRYRPCHNLEIMTQVHLIDGRCGGKFGFISSHASNCFALAVFVGLLLKPNYKFILPALLFWAALVGYSRIYVGVHYPLDILAGAIFGGIVGWIVYKIFEKVNHRFNLYTVP